MTTHPDPKISNRSLGLETKIHLLAGDTGFGAAFWRDCENFHLLFEEKYQPIMQRSRFWSVLIPIGSYCPMEEGALTAWSCGKCIKSWNQNIALHHFDTFQVAIRTLWGSEILEILLAEERLNQPLAPPWNSGICRPGIRLELVQTQNVSSSHPRVRVHKLDLM